MRRVQIYLEESVDDALGAEAAGRRISKAALIRERIGSREPAGAHGTEEDALVGWITERLPDAGTIDEVVYGH